MDVNLRQLRAFLTVAELKSFTRAADLLHLSQPALTVQIRNLETALGSKLLDRTSRLVELMRIGRDLLPAFQRLLRDFDATVTDVREAGSGRRGIVRLAVLPSFAASTLPGLILATRRRNPAVDFVVQDAIAGHIRTMLVSEQVDIGITGGDVTTDEYDILYETTDRLCVIFPARHLIGRKRKILLADLFDLPLVLTAVGTSVRAVVDAAFLAAGRLPNVTCSANYMMTAVAMVRAGLGITILPQSGQEVRTAPELRSRVIDEPAFARRVTIVKKKNRTLPPVTAAFVEDCIAAMRLGSPD